MRTTGSFVMEANHLTSSQVTEASKRETKYFFMPPIALIALTFPIRLANLKELSVP